MMSSTKVRVRPSFTAALNSGMALTPRIASEPLESGGWVATHEDVTERQHGCGSPQLPTSHSLSAALGG
jgi:hypothetical protein